LFTKSEAEWNDVLEKLNLIPDKKVSEVLKISFDGLPDDDVKDIFLDIAFFFIGMDQEDVAKIFKECGYFAVTGISTLVRQSLITIDRKNKIGMHDLLRDMGREIVRMKSKEGNMEPSRIWRYEDVLELSKDTVRSSYMDLFFTLLVLCFSYSIRHHKDRNISTPYAISFLVTDHRLQTLLLFIVILRFFTTTYLNSV
jgi:hypothetical protein